MNRIAATTVPGGLALLFGMVAALSEGAVRDVALILIVASAVTLVALVMRMSARVDPDVVLGGPGYHSTLPTWMWGIHGLGTLIYIIGTVLVVFAAFRDLGFLSTEAPLWFISVTIFVLGLYLAIVSGTAAWKTQEHGFSSTWYSRAHGIALLVAAGLVVLAGVYRLWRPDGFIVQNEFMIYALVVILAVGTQMLLMTHLPTLFDFTHTLARRLQRSGKDEKSTPPVVYAGIVALLVSIVLILLTAQFDLLRKFGGFGDERSVYIIVLIPVILATGFAISAFGVWREARRGPFQGRMTTKTRNDLLVYGLSATAGIIFGITLVRVLVTGQVSLGSWIIDDEYAKDLVALTVISTTAPIGMYLNRSHRRVRNIEARLPDLLNDLAESRRAGLTMFAALKAATKADYGALSVEVTKMSAQVGWGVAFNDALLQFADRVKTPLVERSVRLVVESSRTGGNITAVLRAAARDIREMKGIEEDRRISMSTYIIVVYVVFFVFLVVIASLETQFVPQMLEASRSIAESDLNAGFGGVVDAGDLQFVYFNAAIVQAIGNGLVGGVLVEGRVTSGFRHVAAMTLGAWLLFRVFLAI